VIFKLSLSSVQNKTLDKEAIRRVSNKTLGKDSLSSVKKQTLGKETLCRVFEHSAKSFFAECFFFEVFLLDIRQGASLSSVEKTLGISFDTRQRAEFW
jgi:hypothetical protein